jgi:hypothetical protein
MLTAPEASPCKSSVTWYVPKFHPEGELVAVSSVNAPTKIKADEGSALQTAPWVSAALSWYDRISESKIAGNSAGPKNLILPILVAQMPEKNDFSDE